MSDTWFIEATLYETSDGLRVEMVGRRGGQTTSDVVLAANEADAHAECRNFAHTLGVVDYNLTDARKRSA
jgi:hypothetical protein